MAAVAWTAIGLLATTLGMLAAALFRLDSRIESFGRDLGARIDGVSSDLGARIDGVSSGLGARIDGLSGRIDAQGALQGQPENGQIRCQVGSLSDSSSVVEVSGAIPVPFGFIR